MGFITVDEETLRENPVYGELLEGLEAKAEAKGVAEGKAKGVAEGKVEGVAESVLDVLEDRQISLTEVQRERILAVHDREMLRRWLRAAMHVGSADELFD
jgi:predicted transposase YdaD